MKGSHSIMKLRSSTTDQKTILSSIPILKMLVPTASTSPRGWLNERRNLTGTSQTVQNWLYLPWHYSQIDKLDRSMRYKITPQLRFLWQYTSQFCFQKRLPQPFCTSYIFLQSVLLVIGVGIHHQGPLTENGDYQVQIVHRHMPCRYLPYPTKQAQSCQ